MTVNEAIKILNQLKKQGCGKYPLQIMVVEKGITYADDIEINKAIDADGDRVWIWEVSRNDPDWSKRTPYQHNLPKKNLLA